MSRFVLKGKRGFESEKDYSTFLSDRVDGKAGKPRTDHQLTIEMAKEICMIQRSEIDWN